MEKKSKGEMQKGIAAIRRHMRPFKKELVAIVILGLISAAANGSVPYVSGRFFDALIGVSLHKVSYVGSLPLWTAMLLILAVIQLIANNIDWIMDRLNNQLGYKIPLNIQTEGFIHLSQLPLSYHKDKHINGEIEKISTSAWRTSSVVSAVINIAPQFLSIILGIILSATISHEAAAILLSGVIIYVILLFRILPPVAKMDLEAHKNWNESWDNSAEAVHQIESVKQAAAESYEETKTRSALLEKTYDLWQPLIKIWSNLGFLQRMIVLATQLAIFIVSVHLIAIGTITVGGLIALNGYAMMFFGPFVSLGYRWQTIQNGIMTASQAEEIFEEPREKYMPEGAIQLDRISGRVTFDEVSFRYEPNQPEVLNDISFDIEPGKAVALVGETGVGKSTTISLISGYYFPTKGRILIDGVDTRKLNLIALRKQIAVVPQEVALFNNTIKENIRYGSFDASDAEVMKAAKEAHLDEFIESLPQKYNTIVGERGIKLSVGQKQRVAIARAILRNPAILILDEPTSALDTKTEKIIIGALGRLMRGRTTFIIAHRLSTVRQADIILVFEKGRIVERGSHEDLLLKNRGVYRSFYNHQTGIK